MSKSEKKYWIMKPRFLGIPAGVGLLGVAFYLYTMYELHAKRCGLGHPGLIMPGYCSEAWTYLFGSMALGILGSVVLLLVIISGSSRRRLPSSAEVA